MTIAPLLEAATALKSGQSEKLKLLMPQIKMADGEEVPATGDALDRFLATMDDPDEWRTVVDPVSGERVKLTADELDIIRRIQESEYADAGYDEYQPYVDFFTGIPQIEPILLAPEPKRRFRASKWEALKVAKLVKAIRKGYIVGRSSKKEANEPVHYDLWAGEAPYHLSKDHIAAPKITLPDHAESYNPPEEYLLTEEERAAWEAMDPEDRPRDYVPCKFDAMRKIPGYQRFIQEKFSRCLDLYMCPRAMKNKIVMNPDDLLPVLPDPRDLKPFPTTKSIEFIGHEESSIVKSISVDPSGQWLLSSGTDLSVKLWEIQTGRCIQSWTCPEMPSWVSWNPNRAWICFAVAIGNQVWIIVPTAIKMGTEAIIEALSGNTDSNTKSVIKWSSGNRNEFEGIQWTIDHPQPVTQIRWHRRGDYFSTVAPVPSGDNQKTVITIHQLSTRQSQWPFQKMSGIIRSFAFHPVQPHFIIASSKTVRIYDLVGQKLVRKIIPGLGHGSLSCLEVHPLGDHLLLGSHDAKTLWYDLDAASKPYRILQSHQNAVRSLAFHRGSHPLFASASDDGTVQVVHAQVFQDLMQNPTIVPVKILRGFPSAVNQCEFHPVQPWLFCSSGAIISLFVS